MTKKIEVYRCNVCGNIVEVVNEGIGELVCCNQPMELLKEQTEEGAYEKHVPVIEQNDDTIIVKVGSVEHPMEEKHYIQWIELVADGKVYRKFLKPGEKPVAEFKLKADSLYARAYCNLHGLWRD